SSEALIKGLPMILVNPIPGQEERNARFLVRNGAALQVKRVRELKDLVRLCLSRPRKLKKLSEKCFKISRPYSAQAAVGEILRLFVEWKTEQESGRPQGRSGKVAGMAV